MKNIAPISPDSIPRVKIEEPEELDPIELFWLTNQQFQWKLYEFAIAFGCSNQAVYAWSCGQRKPNKQVRISAALFKNRWGL